MLDRHQKRVPAESVTITIPPFVVSERSFFREDDVVVKVICKDPNFGFELAEDDCMRRVHIAKFAKDGKGTKGKKSCNTICLSERASRRKHCGAYITAINDEEVFTLEEAKTKFAELQDKKADTFTMILAREPSQVSKCCAGRVTNWKCPTSISTKT